jgi:hypothetical protein
MKAEVIKAIQSSIRDKWIPIYLERHVENGRVDCALCDMFFPQYELLPTDWNAEKECQGCPVKEKTGETHCKDTPYWNIIDAFDRFSDEHSEWIEHNLQSLRPCLELYNRAKDDVLLEIDFLNNLLNKEDRLDIQGEIASAVQIQK